MKKITKIKYLTFTIGITILLSYALMHGLTNEYETGYLLTLNLEKTLSQTSLPLMTTNTVNDNGMVTQVSDDAFEQGLAYLGAGVAGIGLLGAGIGQGYAAGKAAEAVGRNPEAESKIRNMMFIGAAIAESSALYALVVAIILIFAT